MGFLKRRISNSSQSAFSLIEVLLALGIISFALLSVVALLPIGIKTNKVSAEEMQATSILTTLEADLSQTHPSGNGGDSFIYGLVLPYTIANGRVVYNTSVALNSLGAGYTTGLDSFEATVPVASAPRPRFQVSVVYVKSPVSGALSGMEAHLIVNWPAINTSNITDLTNPTKVSGYVDTYVSFPAP